MATGHRGSLSVIVEPTLDQARRVYKEMVRMTQDTPYLKRKNDSLLEIEFDNGSQVLFKSAEQRDNLRGFTVTGILVIDECAFILDEIYDILQPTTDVHSAPILMISTPKFRQGFFYRYFTAGKEKSTPNIISIDFNDYDTSMMLSAEKLAQYRQMMPKSQFTTEYLGEFLDTDSILFSNIKECVGNPTAGEYLFFGIDWGTGGGGDFTSICAFNERGEMEVLEYFNDKTTTQQIDRISTLIASYGKRVRCIQAENNSIGTPMIELLSNALAAKPGGLHLTIEPFATTNQEKVKLVSQLQVALENRAITLLDDSGLLNQLSCYEATYNPKTGNVSYNAPPGSHDDNCISCMLALDAMKRKTQSANYYIRYSHR